MSESVRFVVHRVMGRTHRIFRWWIIDVLSVVQITAGEVRPRKPRDTSPAQDYEFIIGEADVGVTNIGPGVGHVEYYLHVAWNAPLDIRITITVENSLVDIQEFDRYRR
jgi:hypothetical protein